MDFPDMDFLGEKKGIIVAGAVGVIAIFAIGKKSSKPTEQQQTATIVPPEGVTWSEISGRRGGVIGTVGPGEIQRGDSAYETFVKTTGYRGTVEEWLESLKGKTGAAGVPGASAPTPKPTPAPVPAPTPKPVPAPKPTGKPRAVDPTGKPYGCPAGYYLGMESTGSGNHVCIANPPGTREIQVVYKKPAGGMADYNPGGTVRTFDPTPTHIAAAGDILVKTGDTMKSLAQRGYGDPSWTELLKQQNPGRRLIVGERWRL